MRVRTGYALLEVAVAAALLGSVAAASLVGVAAAQRDATLAAMRHAALALASERLESLLTGTADTGDWPARVATVLPGGEGTSSGGTGGARVDVRWRVPGVTDTRCPGTACVTLRSGL